MLRESSGFKDWENGEGRGTGPERTGKELGFLLPPPNPPTSCHPCSGREGPTESLLFSQASLGPAHHMCTCSSEAMRVWVDSSPGEGCRRLLVEGRRGSEENREASPGQPGKPLEKPETV